jgi:hypothetical protein
MLLDAEKTFNDFTRDAKALQEILDYLQKSDWPERFKNNARHSVVKTL